MTRQAHDHELVQHWDQLHGPTGRAFRHYPHEELVRFVGSRLNREHAENRRSSCRILELGCGNGANLWMLSREGYSAYGLDISRSALRLALTTLERWDTTAHLLQGDLARAPFRPGSFDAVIDVQSIVYQRQSDVPRVYEMIHHLLRSGGWFFTSQPGKNSYDYDQGGGNLIDAHTFDNIPNPDAIYPNLGQVWMPPRDTVVTLLEQAGFEEVHVERNSRSYHNDTQHYEILIGTGRKR